MPPIRLSYHGKAHYNSLENSDNNIFKQSLLNLQVGLYEDKILEKVKLKQIQAKQYSSESENNHNKEEIEKKATSSKENEKIEFSRGNFIEKGLKDIDFILEKKFANEIIDKNEICAAINDSELIYKDHENELLQKTLEKSKEDHKNEQILGGNYSIQFIIDMGFTTEEAIMAYSAVGDDPDLMLQYLYSLNF